MDAERAQWTIFVASPAAERLRAAIQVMGSCSRVDGRTSDHVQRRDGYLKMFCHVSLSVLLSNTQRLSMASRISGQAMFGEGLNRAVTRMDTGFLGAKFAPLLFAPFAPLLPDGCQFVLLGGYASQCMSLDGRTTDGLSLGAEDALSAEFHGNPVRNV